MNFQAYGIIKDYNICVVIMKASIYKMHCHTGLKYFFKPGCFLFGVKLSSQELLLNI